jgi:hypothetical protein
MHGPKMEMMAQQHRNRHPDPRQTREPRECLGAIVGVYARNGRRNQPSGACDVQKGSRSKHLEREMLHGPNMGISRQFRRLSRVLASKSDFLSFLRNRPPTRGFSFLYPAHPANLPSCTTILVAESQDLKPQMQTVLLQQSRYGKVDFDYFRRNQPRCKAQAVKGG